MALTRSDVLRQRIDLDTNDANRKLDQYGNKAESTAAKVRRSSQTQTTAYQGIASGLRTIGIAAAGLGVAVAGVSALANQAERLSSVSNAFDRLSFRVGALSEDLLPKLRRATRGLVTDFELMQKANNAIILGLPLTSDSMEEMFDIATKLGRSLGVDATRAVESMTTGIGRQSRLMLDNIGIIVDSERAYQKYARELGKTAEELTDAEKKQAFFNEAMIKGREAVKGLTADDALPRLSEIINGIKTSAVNDWDKFVGLIDKLPQTGKAFAQFAAQFASDQIGGLNLPGLPGLAPSLNALGGSGSGGGGSSTTTQQAEEYARILRNIEDINARIAAIRAGEANQIRAIRDGIREARAADEERLELALRMQELTEPIGDPNASGGLFPVSLDGLSESFDPSVFIDMADAVSSLTAAQYENTLATEEQRLKYDMMREAGYLVADALWQAATASDFSTKAIVHATARQVFGVLSALAIENTVRGFTQVALAAAATASGNFAAAAGHSTAAGLHFSAAAKAGGGAVAALAVGAATRPEGSGASSSPSSPTSSTPTAADAEAGRTVDVRIYIEGQGFVQDIEGFAREVGAEVAQQYRGVGAVSFG